MRAASRRPPGGTGGDRERVTAENAGMLRAAADGAIGDTLGPGETSPSVSSRSVLEASHAGRGGMAPRKPSGRRRPVPAEHRIGQARAAASPSTRRPARRRSARRPGTSRPGSAASSDTSGSRVVGLLWRRRPLRRAVATLSHGQKASRTSSTIRPGAASRRAASAAGTSTSRIHMASATRMLRRRGSRAGTGAGHPAAWATPRSSR